MDVDALKQRLQCRVLIEAGEHSIRPFDDRPLEIRVLVDQSGKLAVSALFTLGLIDFAVCTMGGIWAVQIMNLFLKEKINPLIGAAGVSAVPMSARVSQIVGQRYDKGNYLLMHAMGPNLAGVIGSAAAAGMFIAMFD